MELNSSLYFHFHADEEFKKLYVSFSRVGIEFTTIAFRAVRLCPCAMTASFISSIHSEQLINLISDSGKLRWAPPLSEKWRKTKPLLIGYMVDKTKK